MRTSRLMPLALVFSMPLAACSTGEDSQDLQVPVQTPPSFAAGGSDALRMAEDKSLAHLHEVQPELLNGVDAVWTKSVKFDDRGGAHTRVTQTYANIPVWGGEAIVHLKPDGSFESMTDSFVRDIKVNTQTRLTDLEAIDLAVGSEGGWSAVTGSPVANLYIVRDGKRDRLAYVVEIDQFEASVLPAQPVVFVDARTGDIFNRFDNLKIAKNRRTYTANNGTSLPGTLRRSEGQAAVGDATLDQAHDNAGRTYDYYFNTFGRDSYNGAGATITSTVHYSSNYVNAFWNGTQMVYGDGDGTTSGPLTVLDVVAHELTHAVTSSESNLVYQNESGALNEGMSDIFAAAVEASRDGGANANTWKVGEECWTPGTAGDALRYMNNPTADGSSRDYYPERYTGTQDNGGVHWNSGIANLAFYLLSQGGTHPRNKTTVVVPAIGIVKAAAIFYDTNTNRLTSTSNYQAACNATVASATALYDAATADATTKAWAAVGVSCGNTPPPPATQLSNGQTVSNLSGSTGTWGTLYFVDIPAGSSNLKVTISGGTGDADLYVKFGAQPTSTSYDCRPYLSGNAETCTFATPSTGKYYIQLNAYTSFSGVSLNVSWSGSSSDKYPGNELSETGLGASTGNWVHRTLNVPADATKLTVTISGGTGDADLYVRFGAQPTTTAYNCRPYLSGNNETCTFQPPSAGTYFISIRAYTTFSGVSLVGNYQSN